MKCCPRKNYNYEYVHYNGENIKELQELADPVKVSQTETGAVIHLIERGHYNLCPEIGDFIVKKSCGEEISFELFNEDDFKDNFMSEDKYKNAKFVNFPGVRYLLNSDGYIRQCCSYLDLGDEIIIDAYKPINFTDEWKAQYDTYPHIKKENIIGWFTYDSFVMEKLVYEAKKCKTKKAQEELTKKINDSIKAFIKKLLDFIE